MSHAKFVKLKKMLSYTIVLFVNQSGIIHKMLEIFLLMKLFYIDIWAVYVYLILFFTGE